MVYREVDTVGRPIGNEGNETYYVWPVWRLTSASLEVGHRWKRCVIRSASALSIAQCSTGRAAMAITVSPGCTPSLIVIQAKAHPRLGGIVFNELSR